MDKALVSFDLASDYPFDITYKDIRFYGILKKANYNLIKCKANIKGVLEHACDRCADDIKLDIDEKIELLLTNEIFKDNEHKVLDVIEIFDEKIDLYDILQSELQAYKSDYFYCKNCENL